MLMQITITVIAFPGYNGYSRAMSNADLLNAIINTAPAQFFELLKAGRIEEAADIAMIVADRVEELMA